MCFFHQRFKDGYLLHACGGLWGKALKSLEGGSSNFRQNPQLLGQHRLSALPSHAQSLGTLFSPLNFPQTGHGGDRGPETEALRLALGHLRAGGLYGGLIPWALPPEPAVVALSDGHHR